MMDEPTRARIETKALRGMGRVFERGKTWWIAYYHNGREVRESSKSTHERAAAKLLKQRLGEMSSRRFVGPREERVKFEDLASGYERDYELRGLRSVRAAKARIKHLREFFGEYRARDITSERIRTYQAARRKANASPATVNRETSALARMFRLLVKSGEFSIAPSFPERLEESTPRQGFFERHEYLAVRQNLGFDYADVLDFAYYSGWRKREITDLTWAEIDLAAGVIRLSPERSKTRTGRVLPLSSPMLTVLQRRVSPRRLDCLLVFHRNGNRMVDWRRAWASACKAAKLPGKRLHDCRRTAARNLVRARVPERVAMQLTGHKTRSVFDRYNIVAEDDLQVGVDLLAAYVEQQPTEAKVIALKKAAS
jgi:integrase